MQADIRDIECNILGKFDEYFQRIDERLQYNDTMIRRELSLLTSQIANLQPVENTDEEALTCQWRQKMEECQTRLLEDVGYIQYVVEEVAKHPYSNEAQQKLRENFFIREIAALKEEMTSVKRKIQSMEQGYSLKDGREHNESVALQQDTNLESEEQTKIYKKKRKRRY